VYKNFTMDKLYIFKIGNENRPANQADMDEFEQELNKALQNKGDSILVSHHAVEVIVIDKPVEPIKTTS
jgi:hypothetical protein